MGDNCTNWELQAALCPWPPEKKGQGRIRTMWTGVESGYLYYVNQGKKESPLTMRDGQI